MGRIIGQKNSSPALRPKIEYRFSGSRQKPIAKVNGAIQIKYVAIVKFHCFSVSFDIGAWNDTRFFQFNHLSARQLLG
jgi:hypothetical protein